MGANKKSSELNYFEQYYEEITEGRTIVGKWVKLIIEILINGLEEGLFFYDKKKAEHAINWIEAHCFHTEGPLAPGPLILELWQKVIVAAIFGIVDEEGYRHFREVIVVVARKNGKSLLWAAIAKYVWYNDGFGTKVYCLAPKLEQADIIYDNVWQMTQLDPEWQQLKQAVADSKDGHNMKTIDDSELARHRQSDLFIPSTNSKMKKVAFSAKKSDGFNPSLCECDEIASWEGDKGLKQYDVMKSGMGARPEGVLLSCSTAGYINDSIYDELMKRATRFLLGDSKESKILPFLYIIDDEAKWNDLTELRKSNPNLNVSVTEKYLIEEIAVAEGSLPKKAEFLTKYCNIKQNSSAAWLNTKDIEKCCGKHLSFDDFRNTYAVGGLDLSQTTDLTFAICTIERDGIINVFGQAFMPAEKIEEATARDGVPYSQYVKTGELMLSGDNFVDYHDCFNWFRNLVEEYKIYPLMIGYDRYSAQYLVQDLNAYGFRTDDVFQGFNLTPVIREAEGLIKDGKINIGDNSLLKMHLLDTAIKSDNENNKIKIIKVASTVHIDGVAALLDALTVRQKWWDEMGERLKN